MYSKLIWDFEYEFVRVNVRIYTNAYDISYLYITAVYRYKMQCGIDDNGKWPQQNEINVQPNSFSWKIQKKTPFLSQNLHCIISLQKNWKLNNSPLSTTIFKYVYINCIYYIRRAPIIEYMIKLSCTLSCMNFLICIAEKCLW